MLRITEDTLPIYLHRIEEVITILLVHLLMPRREPRSSLVGHSQIPLGIRDYPRSAVGIFRLWVNDLDVFLIRFFGHVPAVGFRPPLADTGRVGP